MTVATTIAASPFRGLAAYGDSDLDALFFFGREREVDVISSNMIASRLTVFYGATGVGKSSVLRAGVVRALRAVPFPREVVVYQAWSSSPVAQLAQDVASAAGVSARTSLTETIADAAAALDGELYLILDQFEELFAYDHGDLRRGSFLTELADALTQGDVRASILLSLRDDALSKLDVLKTAVPALFANYLRLDHLDREAGRRAILGPVDRWNELFADGNTVHVEPALVDAVLDQVTKPEGGIETPYLQLVLERLWEREREQSSSVLRAETLDELGGARTIVGEHLTRALESLSPQEQTTAASLFLHMVTPSGTKIAQSVPDLARYASVERDEVETVADKLIADRVFRSVAEPVGEQRLEIFHDVLAPAVTDWRTRFEAQQGELRARREAEAGHRRAMRLAVAALAALVVVAAIAVFALAQRSQARDHARTARANELVARALLVQPSDPGAALALSLDASRLESGSATEGVLRSSLMASRLRRLAAFHSPVTAVSWLAAGQVAVALRDGRVVIWDVIRDRMIESTRFRGAVVGLDKIPHRAAFVVVAGNRAFIWGADRHPIGIGHAAAAHVSADGSRVAVAAADGVVLRSSVDGSVVRRIDASGARDATFAPDSRTIAVVRRLEDGHVRAFTYDVRTGRELASSPRIGVTKIVFSPGSRLLAAGSADGTVGLWPPRTGRPVRVLADGGNAIRDLAFDPAGELLATASSDGGVRVWRVADASRFFLFLGHALAVTRVAFSPDATYLASASEDGTARIWITGGIGAGRVAAVLAGSRGPVTAAAFAAGGHSLVTGADDGTARLWEPRIEQHLVPVGWYRLPVAAVRATRRGVVALTGGLLRIGRERIYGRVGNVVALSNGLLAAADAKRVVVRTLSGGDVRAAFGMPAAPTAIAIAAGDDALAAAAGGRVRVWSLPGGRTLGDFPVSARVVRIAVASGGATVATADRAGGIQLWSVHGRRLHALRLHDAAVTDLRFDALGRRLVTAASGSRDNAALWDVGSGRLVTRLAGHFGTVTAASFSPDDRWVLTAGPITGAIWSAADGALLFYLRGPTDLLTDAEWSWDGNSVVTGERDGIVREYRCAICGTLPQLQALATARLAAGR